MAPKDISVELLVIELCPSTLLYVVNFGILNFGHWDLFVICDLLFGFL